MKYGSVCSGVEAASLAWMPLGWEPQFFAEVEPFPAAVLMERFNATKPLRPLDPNGTKDEKERKIRTSWEKDIVSFRDGGEIVNFGDFTKITKDDLNGNTIDLLVGGCPCQDFSVAGKRMGLDGHRGSLSLEFIRLAYQLGVRWVVFENVPGLLSQDDGRAFGSFLSGLSGCEITPPADGWKNAGIVRNARKDRFGLAWRILDAQFTRVSRFPFAVPQRRRRIFVVGYFGDWRRAAAVLFERDGVYRNTPPRRKTREEIAADAGRCAAFAGGAFLRGAVAGHAGDGGNGNPGAESGSETGDGNYADGTLLRTGFQVSHGEGRESDVSCTLDVKCKDGAIRNQAGMAVVETGKGFYSPSDCAGTLESNEDQHRRNIICAGFMGGQGAKAGGIGFGEQTSPTIKASPSGGNQIPDVVLSLAAAQAGELGCIGENISQTLSRNNGGFSYIAAVKNGETQKILRVGDKMMSQYGEVAGTLEARHDSSPCADRGQNIVCYENHAQDSRVKELDGVFPQINAKAGMGGGNLPLVQECYPINGMVIGKEAKDDDPSLTIGAGQHHAVAIAENWIGRKPENGPNGIGVQPELAYTQNATGVMAVCTKGNGDAFESAVHTTVSASGGGMLGHGSPAVRNGMSVRRLLPLETERLMGFPDNWTRIPWKGKPEEECPDSPRYKACGNSMCVNVMEWIGCRIELTEREMNR